MAAAQLEKIRWASSLDLIPADNANFTAEVPLDFCWGTRAHGGHMTDLMGRAARLCVRANLKLPKLPDILHIDVHWLRLATVGTVNIHVEILSRSRTGAVAEVRLSQNEKLSATAIVSLADLSSEGHSFDTQWVLDPPPRPVDFKKLACDEDPEWASYQVPWHPKSYLRIYSNFRMFLPRVFHANKTIRDMWITPVDADPDFAWTNEHLNYVADMTFSPLENWQEGGVASNEKLILATEAQRADREAGKPLKEKILGLSPLTSFSSSMNIDIKKRLPEKGTKWLFTRTSSKEAKHGRMDWEVTIHDDLGELVAIAQVFHHIIALKDNPMPGGTNGKTGKPKV